MAVQRSLFASATGTDEVPTRRRRRRVHRRVDQSLDGLISRLLEGAVVPFLGAGISLHCEGPDRSRIASTTVMTCSVCKAMRADLQPPCHCPCCDGKSKCGKRRDLAQACEEYLWQRSRRSLVFDVLRIKDFEHLQISEAHRYIAYLAREGLVSEVITTNYDTSLERAYRDSLGDPGREGATASISSLSKYRRHGATMGGQAGIPFLKVYHINGCAADLVEGSARAGESIVLTERQLQDWGKRQWAKDLLRDRLRSRSILFSGFGSPEPQVRHTVLQIVEEFDAGSWEDNGSSNVYIHAYDDLTFEQKQILVSYSRACGKRASHSWGSNCFTGQDASAFGLTSSDELPADSFWKYLFMRVFWRLLGERWLSLGTAYHYFLLRYATCAEILLRNVRDWLLPPGVHISRRFPEYLNLNDHGMRLATILWRIRFRGTDMKRGWYAPLRERGLLLSAFFTFCYLLERLKFRIDDLEDHGTLGYGMRVTNTKLLCISDGSSLFRSGEELVSKCRDWSVIVQIVIDETAVLEQKRVKLVEKPGGTHWRMATVYQIPFGEFIARRDGSSVSSDDVLSAARTAIECPRIVVDRSRRHRRHRVRLL